MNYMLDFDGEQVPIRDRTLPSVGDRIKLKSFTKTLDGVDVNPTVTYVVSRIEHTLAICDYSAMETESRLYQMPDYSSAETRENITVFIEQV